MKLIVIDIETTGLDIAKDEILQISIIDEKYNTLLNEYCKPDTIQDWKDAEAVHGITPEMVKDKPSFHCYVNNVQQLISSAERIVVYNGLDFDLKMLEKYGIHIDYTKAYDLMLEIDKEYRKWFKLVDLANYYGYEFKAHDSLEDTKATLYCYYKFIKEKRISFYYYRNIDWILNNLEKKVLDKATPLSTEGTTIYLSFFGRYAGVSTSIRGYRQHLLFSMNDKLVDSHCTCLDCLDGGNRMCKHVVASLMILGSDAKPYTMQHKMNLEKLKEKKQS